MKKYIRFLSLLLVLTMIASMLFACFGKEDNEPASTESKSSDTTDDSNDSSENNSNTDSGNDKTDNSGEEDSSTSKPDDLDETKNTGSPNLEDFTSPSITEGNKDTEKVTEKDTDKDTVKDTNKDTAKDSNNATDTDKATDTESSNVQIDPEKFFLLSNKAYSVKVVVPDISSTAEDIVYTKIRAVLKNITGVSVTYCSDFLAANQTRSPNEMAILIGNTNYEESTQANSKLPYGKYALSITDTKIVFSFTSKAEGLELVELFEKSVKTDDNGTFWISRKFSVSKQKFLQLKDVPRHPSIHNTLVDCNDSTSMVVAEKTTLPEFRTYCDTLVQSGYVLYSSRDDVNGNYFRTYTKNSIALTVYFTAYSKTTRIIAGPLDDIPPAEADPTPENCTPSLTIISQGENWDNGLGLIYLLPNGKFLIFDGGYTLNGKIYKLLQELAPDEDNIVITAWFMSHPHGDHQQALQSFLKSYGSKVTIESILFNYTTSDQYEAVTTGADGMSGLNSMQNTLSRYVSKNTKIIKPHTGQIYKYGSAEVEIMYTVEDVLPKTLDYLNTSSLVIRVKIGEHSHLILADTTHVSGDIMRSMYGTYLKSEMVQLAHHGTYPGNASLYEAIKAPVLIWPSNYQNAKVQQTNVAVVAALKYATDVYVANVDNITLKLPYTPINNKDSFMAQISPTT